MTDLQQTLLDYLHARHEAGSEAPQTSDVVRHFRSRRESGVIHTLEGLAKAGHVEAKNGRWVLKTSQVQLHLIPVEGAGPRQQ